MTRSATRCLFAFVCTFAATFMGSPVFAQDDDKALKPAEPDFALVSLPTALRLPQGGSAFHMTHRFGLAINKTDAGEVFERLFGIDSPASTGLEYRIGVVKNGQIGVHHATDNRTWSFFGQYGIARQDQGLPVDISAIAAVDIVRLPVPTTTTFQRDAVPGFALLVSRSFNDRAAIYVEPIVVTNVYSVFAPPPTKDSSFVLGLGGRVRIRPTVSLVVEAAPRVAGFKGNQDHVAFGIEKRAGGHVFQLNFSNSAASTLSQLAQGGAPANLWHMGFNITRKFY